MKRLYLLYRSISSPLLLHPFAEKKQLLQLHRMDLEGVYPHEPTEDDRVHMLYGLYSLIDAAVDTWVQELKYIPRLLASAVAFLLVYLFAALVIRIPVPLVDELILSSAAAVLVYLTIARKNTKSEIATKRRIELKEYADTVTDRSDETFAVLQERFSQLESFRPLELADMICSRRDFPVELPSGTASQEVYSCLTIALRRTRRLRRLMRRIGSADDQRQERLAARLFRLGSSGKVDLPLIALYRLMELNQQK